MPDEIATTLDLTHPGIPEAWVGQRVCFHFTTDGDDEPEDEGTLLAVNRIGFVVRWAREDTFIPWTAIEFLFPRGEE